MSWNFGSGLGTAIGASIGSALMRPLIAARLRRFAREASGHLDDGEKLVAPVARCNRGAWKAQFWGTAIFVPAGLAGIFVGFNESLFGVVLFGVMCAGLLVGWTAFFVAHRHAVALTDRRLIVFRLSSASGRRLPARHIKDIFVAAKRSDVSTDFKSRLGWGFFSLNFAPATGQAPIQLDFFSVDTQIAGAIHQALATTAPRAPGSTRLPTGP